MLFGISSTPEEFQRRTLDIIEGLSGVLVKADDLLIVGGETMEERIANHDYNFIKLMERCCEKGYKLNLTKLLFTQPEVKYHGHNFSSGGI